MSVGLLLVIIGIVVAVLVSPILGVLAIIAGIVLLATPIR